jgi:hypothetical protein
VSRRTSSCRLAAWLCSRSQRFSLRLLCQLARSQMMINTRFSLRRATLRNRWSIRMTRSVSGCPSEKYKNLSPVSWRTAPKQAKALSGSLGLGWRSTRCSSSPVAAQLCIRGWAKRLNQHSSWSSSKHSECVAAQSFNWSRLFFGAHTVHLDCVSSAWPDATRCPSLVEQGSHCVLSLDARRCLPTSRFQPAIPVSRRWLHVQTAVATSESVLATVLEPFCQRHSGGRVEHGTSLSDTPILLSRRHEWYCAQPDRCNATPPQSDWLFYTLRCLAGSGSDA